jgi:hypothetical protein
MLTCARGIASPVKELTTTPVTVQRGTFLLTSGRSGPIVWPEENAATTNIMIANTPELHQLRIDSPGRELRAKGREYLIVIPI